MPGRPSVPQRSTTPPCRQRKPLRSPIHRRPAGSSYSARVSSPCVPWTTLTLSPVIFATPCSVPTHMPPSRLGANANTIVPGRPSPMPKLRTVPSGAIRLTPSVEATQRLPAASDWIARNSRLGSFALIAVAGTSARSS